MSNNSGAVPAGINNNVAPAPTGVAPGINFGGTGGVGFHDTQPVRLDLNEATVQWHRDDADGALGDPTTVSVPDYPTWPESPFVTYCPRPTSNGRLPPILEQFVPEDRSKMGTPLNPFWIRNGVVWDEHEADIFLQPDDFLAPRFELDHLPQAPQSFARDAYLKNEEQPQYSSGSGDSGLAPRNIKVPMASACGGVSAPQDNAPEEMMGIGESNPAMTEPPEGSERPGDEDQEQPKGPPEQDISKDSTQETPGEPPKRKRGRPRKRPVPEPTGTKAAKKTKPQ